MNKKEFLGALESNLQELDKEDIAEILEDYKLLIEEQVLEGATEDEVISKLEAPRKIAEEYMEELKINRKEESFNDEKEFKKIDEKKKPNKDENMVFFVILQVLNLFIAVSFLIPFAGTVFGILVSGISVLIASVASIFAIGIFDVFTTISIIMLLVGLGFLLTNCAIVLGYGSIKLLRKYIKWNISLIK